MCARIAHIRLLYSIPLYITSILPFDFMIYICTISVGACYQNENSRARPALGKRNEI